MPLDDEIRDFIARANLNIASQRIRDRGILYAEGLKGKVHQAEMALNRLASLCTTVDVALPEDEQQYSVMELVQFYCEAYSAFLYSSLDILAQIINQVRRCGMDEHEVSIKRIRNWLNQNAGGTPLQTTVDGLAKSRVFTSLDRYRNCCLHRRHIYIRGEQRRVDHAPGYSATGPVATITWLIADNPLDLQPSVLQNRQIPDYLQRSFNTLQPQLEAVLQMLP